MGQQGGAAAAPGAVRLRCYLVTVPHRFCDRDLAVHFGLNAHCSGAAKALQEQQRSVFLYAAALARCLGGIDPLEVVAWANMPSCARIGMHRAWSTHTCTNNRTGLDAVRLHEGLQEVSKLAGMAAKLAASAGWCVMAVWMATLSAEAAACGRKECMELLKVLLGMRQTTL